MLASIPDSLGAQEREWATVPLLLPGTSDLPIQQQGPAPMPLALEDRMV